MLSSNEIRGIKFSKSVGGYKQEEVDILLDKVEADYEQFDRIISDLQKKNEEMSAEIEGYKASQNSIQNVLLNAQKLADQIIDEAKTKRDEIVKNAEDNIEHITVQERELVAAFDKKADERKAALEAELSAMLREAENKKAIIEKATADAVTRQQMLFDKLKIEVAAFKADVTARYKEHLEVLTKLPDAVPDDPTYITKLLKTALDKPLDESEYTEAPTEQEPVASVEPISADEGFTVSSIGEELDEK